MPYSAHSNARWLVIVESPSKCKKIEEYLGSQYACIASKGHIRNIDGLKHIDMANGFAVDYSIIPEKRAHIENMRKIIGKFSKDCIILATDDDREGEAIAWHICQVFALDLSITHRIIFREITKPALNTAIHNPVRINMELVYAQQARQIVDILVGYKISPILWRLVYGKDHTLSAGRCQSPALRLVYENEMERRKKDGYEYKYKVVGWFSTQNIEFTLDHVFAEENDLSAFLKQTMSSPYTFSISEKGKGCTIHPPKPFNTSHLLQTVSHQLHYSPKETMSLCQQLYQDGYITYMRTDSTKYSANFLDDAAQFIQKEWKDPRYVGPIDDIVNRDDTNPHEAIRVTHLDCRSYKDAENDVGTNRRLSALYKLIWQNTAESCMTAAQYSNTLVEIRADKAASYVYKHTIEMPIFMGWKRAADKTADILVLQQVATGKRMFIENLILSGGMVTYNYIESRVSVQSRHSHYTEASLIKELEAKGIGRPSTFATIMETIQERGYVKRADLPGEQKLVREYKVRPAIGNSSAAAAELEVKEVEKVFGSEKNKLIITDLGVITIEFLTEHFDDLFSYGYTNEMEGRLDHVHSEMDVCDICTKCNERIDAGILPLAHIKQKTFAIDDTYTLVFYRNGASIRYTRLNEDGTEENAYLNLKPGLTLDMDRLKRGEYTIDDLVDLKDDFVGIFEGQNVYLKQGPYGAYVEWGSNKKSLKTMDSNKDVSKINPADIIEWLEKENQTSGDSGKILRELNEWISIRNGKYGAYIYYKHKTMKKPQFFSLNGYSGDHWSIVPVNTLLEWIFATYKFRV
jgi:DNA topoisomerase-1